MATDINSSPTSPEIVAPQLMFTATDQSRKKTVDGEYRTGHLLRDDDVDDFAAYPHRCLPLCQGSTGPVPGVLFHEPFTGNESRWYMGTAAWNNLYRDNFTARFRTDWCVSSSISETNTPAKAGFTRIINLAVVNLAGVPSIVHALFGVGAFVYFARMGRSVLAASLTLAIMTLPVIIASTKEALGAVPMAFREACWNTGATRWQTISGIVLPNSISGILTGIILQVSRAAGETAPIMFTGAVFFKAISEGDVFAYGLLDRFMALSMHLYQLSTQVPGVPEAVEYGTAVVLLGAVLMVNALAIVLRVYLRARKRW